MRATTLTSLFVLVANLSVQAQGQFIFFNLNTPTRLGSEDGPRAGRGFWAQMLVGTNLDFLMAVGTPLEHNRGGIVGGIGAQVIVPGIPCFQLAFVQMVAWDGTRWGTTLADVPPEQLGRTDIVLMQLACFPDPFAAPNFARPAVVPVPEPSAVGLGLLGGALLLARRRAKRVR